MTIEELFQKYNGFVCTAARSLNRNPADQDDAAAAVWLRLVQAPDLIDGDGCTGCVQAMLYRLVRQATAEIHRRRHPVLALDRSTIDEEGHLTTVGALVPARARPEPDAALDAGGITERLTKTLGPVELSALQDVAEGMCVARAARDAGLSRNQLRRALARTRKRYAG